MKIALLGTRGVPNRYGGFEEFAVHMCKHWANRGHEVIVYCEDTEKREDFKYENVKQVFIRMTMLPGMSQIIYDFRSTRHAVKMNCDIYYHAGYATAVLGNIYFRRQLSGRLVYNMDGLEWMRSKFNNINRWIIKRLERKAALSGAHLVSDNKGIQNYILREYGVGSALIEYGANVIDVKSNNYDSYPNVFDLVIARCEPENHIEEIVTTYESNANVSLVLVMNTNTKLFSKLHKRISNVPNIICNGPIYDKNELDYLKANCRYYIHGHSVGGTNPSLLEAMVAGCHILSHDNEFNRDVVANHAHFWADQKALYNLVCTSIKRPTMPENQIKYCLKRFDWSVIAQKHLQLFQRILLTCN